MEGITMFETPITVVGNIVNDPNGRRVGDQEVIKFRGRLVTGVGAALRKGDPVIVVGQVYTSEYEDRDGNRRSTLEMRATAVGPDLSRSIVRIIEKTGPARDADLAQSTEAAQAEVEDDTEGAVAAVDGKALPL